jgi:hypothetical protein
LLERATPLRDTDTAIALQPSDGGDVTRSLEL